MENLGAPDLTSSFVLHGFDGCDGFDGQGQGA